MERAENVVRSLVKDLGMESSLGLYRIASRWDAVFQGPLAHNTCPVRLAGGELLVNVASPAWLQQAAFYKNRMLEKLTALGVKDIRFRLGRINRKSLAPNPPSRPITEKEMRFIDEVVSSIGDEALATGIRRAMEKCIQRGRERVPLPGDEDALPEE